MSSLTLIFLIRLNGIDFEEVRIDLAKGQHLSPEFKGPSLHNSDLKFILFSVLCSFSFFVTATLKKVIYLSSVFASTHNSDPVIVSHLPINLFSFFRINFLFLNSDPVIVSHIIPRIIVRFITSTWFWAADQMIIPPRGSNLPLRPTNTRIFLLGPSTA